MVLSDGAGDLRTKQWMVPVLAVGMLAHCSVARAPDPGAAPGRTVGAATEVFTLDSLVGSAAGDNRLFLEYDPAGSSRWNTDWPGRVDLTGVAWDSPRTATAITPRHVVMAAHYPRKIGDVLVFHDRSGKRHARTLEKTVSLRTPPTPTDIVVGLLDRPLPDLIKTYPLLEPRDDYAERLAGGPVLVTEQSRRLFIHEVWYVTKANLRCAFSPSFDPSMRKSLVGGDSGNPAFLLVAGEPVLLETHSMGGSGSGPFYAAPVNFARLEAAVRTLDPRYRIRTVPLEDRYARLAASRRVGNPNYEKWNPDGSLKSLPVRRENHPPQAGKPPSPAPPGQKTPTPGVPRVRRLPDKKPPPAPAPKPAARNPAE